MSGIYGIYGIYGVFMHKDIQTKIESSKYSQICTYTNTLKHPVKFIHALLKCLQNKVINFNEQ